MCVALSLVLMFMPRRGECIAAYAALVIASFVGDIATSTLLFWGVATLIVIGLYILLPRTVSTSRVGVPYIAGATITGTMLALALNTQVAVIPGAAIGAVLGAIAYSRTRGGHVLEFPSRRFFNYLAAKGLPTVVTASMAALAMLSLIAAATPYTPNI